MGALMINHGILLTLQASFIILLTAQVSGANDVSSTAVRSQHGPYTKRALNATSTTTPGPQASEVICDTHDKAAAWKEFGMDEYLRNCTYVDLMFLEQQTPLDTFVNFSTNLSADGYVCSFENPCDHTLPLQLCGQNPPAMLAVAAIANFNHFVTSTAALMQKARDDLDVAYLAEVLTPIPPASPRPPTTDSEISFGLSVAAAILGLLGVIPGLEALEIPAAVLGAALSIASGAVSSFQSTSDNSPAETEFNSFANVSATINALNSASQTSLQNLVDSALNTPPQLKPLSGFLPAIAEACTEYTTRPGDIPSLLSNGTFANPIPDLPANATAPDGSLAAALVSPVFNNNWLSASTAVVKSSRKSLPWDPCGNDDLFPQNLLWCDTQGNFWTFISQQIPLEPPNFTVFSTTPPGVANLTEFGLNVQTLVTAANKTQAKSNSDGDAVSVESFISAIRTLDPRHIETSDLISFNLPVCDLDRAPKLSMTQSASCAVLDTSERFLCSLYTQTVCGCPVVLGHWPYTDPNATAFCGRDGPPCESCM